MKVVFYTDVNLVDYFEAKQGGHKDLKSGNLVYITDGNGIDLDLWLTVRLFMDLNYYISHPILESPEALQNIIVKSKFGGNLGIIAACVAGAQY